MNAFMCAELLDVLNVLESTEFEIMCHGPSKLHISSIIPFLEILLVYYAEDQVGF